MERKELLQAISEVKQELDKQNMKLSMLIKAACQNGFLQQTTDIHIDIAMMCEVLSLDVNDVLSVSKKQELADARAIVAWHLVHTFLHNKYQVSKALLKDHSTVNSMLERYDRYLVCDERFRSKDRKIKESFYLASIKL